MNTPAHTLPAGFESLQKYVATWAIPNAAARARQRRESNEAERNAFYKDTLAVFQDAIASLDNTPVEQHSEQEKTLMNLLLSFAHVSLAVEVQGRDEAMHAQQSQYMLITQASADR